MIPVTTFAGKKVAVFGLGASGLASASALFGGGADVIGWDDSEARVAHATKAGIPTADLRDVDWSKIAALVLSPGVPLTHPAPHWTVGLARAAGVEVIGDIELFCRERRSHLPDSIFVAITGTNGKSTTTALVAHLLEGAGFDVQLGGNIGTAILSLEPLRPGRAHVIECSSYQIDLAPSLDPKIGILLNITEDHLDRHGTLKEYAAVKERLVAGVQRNGTAIVGVDDKWCQAAADRLEHLGKQVVRVSVRRPLPYGIYVEGEEIMQAAGGTARPLALLGGIGSLRGVHNAQNAACATAAARIAWKRSAARAAFCSSTIRRPPTRTPRRARSPVSATFSGSPAASRRPGASSRSPNSSRASAKPIWSARPRRNLPRRSTARWSTSSSARSIARSRRRRRTPTLRGSSRRWCCSRPPARRTTSIPISRFAATSSANWCGRFRASRREAWHPHAPRPITAGRGEGAAWRLRSRAPQIWLSCAPCSRESPARGRPSFRSSRTTSTRAAVSCARPTSWMRRSRISSRSSPATISRALPSSTAARVSPPIFGSNYAIYWRTGWCGASCATATPAGPCSRPSSRPTSSASSRDISRRRRAAAMTKTSTTTSSRC